MRVQAYHNARPPGQSDLAGIAVVIAIKHGYYYNAGARLGYNNSRTRGHDDDDDDDDDNGDAVSETNRSAMPRKQQSDACWCCRDERVQVVMSIHHYHAVPTHDVEDNHDSAVGNGANHRDTNNNNTKRFF